jgi:hypothetical protein
MIDFVAEEKKWVVLTERVELIPVEIDQQFTSSQVCEIYDNEEEAHNRMIELDPEWEDPIVTELAPDPEDSIVI